MTEEGLSTGGQLEQRLEFETLISDTSASLLAAPPDGLSLAVEEALTRVRVFCEADRCALLSVTPDRQVVKVRLASYGEGVSQVPLDLDLAPAFPWSRHTLLVERAPVRVARMADLPPEADVERENWNQMSIRSALTLPIETGGGALHLILLNTVHAEREWPDALVSRLRVLGEMLVGALEKQAMLAGLREAEERVSLAADAAGAGLWALDPATEQFWATARARRIFGYAPEEVISVERFEASVHPDDRDRVRGVIDAALQSRETMSVEYRVVRGDGRVRWIASRGRPCLDSTGRQERLTGLSVDVTDRKLAEEALRRSEARLVAGAKLAGLGYYEIDYGTNAITVDPGFRDICGVPPDREQGLQPVEFWLGRLDPADREQVVDVRRRMHDGRLEQISLEYRYHHPARGEIWIHHLGGVATRDADGRAVLTYGVLRDVTARKQNEDELRDLSRRLIRAQEEERALLARELHDDVTQRLAVLAIDVGRVERVCEDGPQAGAMRALHESLVRMSEDIHSLAYQLHPSVLEDLGLVEALRAECERRGRQSRVALSVVCDAVPPTIDRDVALCLFRVAQEALTNAVRHAQAQAARVVLRSMDGGLLLAVSDDGVGFDLDAPPERKSLGLASMRERVSLLKGTLDIESAPDRGTSVVAWVPLEGPTR